MLRMHRLLGSLTELLEAFRPCLPLRLAAVLPSRPVLGRPPVWPRRPLAVLITAGQRGNSLQFQAVLERIRVPRPGRGRPRTRPLRVLPDKAYGSRANRRYLRRRGIRCTIPDKADQAPTARTRAAPALPERVRPELCKQRHAVNAGSAGSSATGRSPPATTNSRPLPGHRAGHSDQRMAATSQLAPARAILNPSQPQMACTNQLRARPVR
jgi:hypothetical protein